MGAGSSSFRGFKSLLSRSDALLKEVLSLLEAHSGTFFFSLRESRLKKSLKLKCYLDEMLHRTGTCTTAGAAEDLSSFLNMQPAQ